MLDLIGYMSAVNTTRLVPVFPPAAIPELSSPPFLPVPIVAQSVTQTVDVAPQLGGVAAADEVAGVVAAAGGRDWCGCCC